ncbi:hypothetical protein VTL71DRAFT_11338 [Oculimacula yallundae]|uniref:Uncharacterized protein n=1 Tax=Oculimacula yallundae TaxID=86028 RepID=A0ABR4CQ79_9HELO
MDILINLDDNASISSSNGNSIVEPPIELLPVKEHLPLPESFGEISTLMDDVFDALGPEERRYHDSRLTANLRFNLLDNATSAIHRNRHTSRARLLLFDKLPAETRARIWRIAAKTLQIIELESYHLKHPAGKFLRIEVLAVSRDLLVRTMDPYECIMRHLFPKLRMLIVLVDDALDIDDVWNINHADEFPYRRYERTLRFGFLQDSVGLFKEVVTNIEYKNALLADFKENFDEEKKNLHEYASNYMLEDDENGEKILKDLDEQEDVKIWKVVAWQYTSILRRRHRVTADPKQHATRECIHFSIDFGGRGVVQYQYCVLSGKGAKLLLAR